MKKVTLFAALALLAGCEAVPAAANAPTLERGPTSDLRVFVDPATGCEYLSNRYANAALTPRYEFGGYGSNGTVVNRVRGCK